jgi:transcriptional regulator with XRE-family HTH domain
VVQHGFCSYGRGVPQSASSIHKRLAQALRRERAHRGWTQERAAEAAGMNPRHYQKLEEGSVNATLRTLKRLCDAYDVDVRDLFSR